MVEIVIHGIEKCIIDMKNMENNTIRTINLSTYQPDPLPAAALVLLEIKKYSRLA